MRLITYRHEGMDSVGALLGSRVVCLSRAYAGYLHSQGVPSPYPLAAAGLPGDMLLFLSAGEGALSAARQAIDFVYLTLAILAAACLQAAALIAIGSLAFVLVRSGFAFSLYYSLKSFLSFPLSVYGVGIQWLLTFAVPLAFINFYPASLLLGKEGGIAPSTIGWIAPLIGPAVIYAAYRLFDASASRYQGAGG